MDPAVPSPTSSAAGRRARSSAASRDLRATRVRRARMTARASILTVVVLMLLTLSVAPLRTLLDQRSELTHLQEQTEQLAYDNAKLERRIAELNDPVYLERLARECLGMIKPGETAFVLIPRKGPPPTPQC